MQLRLPQVAHLGQFGSRASITLPQALQVYRENAKPQSRQTNLPSSPGAGSMCGDPQIKHTEAISAISLMPARSDRWRAKSCFAISRAIVAIGCSRASKIQKCFPQCIHDSRWKIELVRAERFAQIGTSVFQFCEGRQFGNTRDTHRAPGSSQPDRCSRALTTFDFLQQHRANSTKTAVREERNRVATPCLGCEALDDVRH